MLDKLRELLEQEPFEPFQFVVTSGDRFRIANPHLVTLTESLLTYYFPRSDGHALVRLNQFVSVQVGEER